jgi:hypothetical protein
LVSGIGFVPMSANLEKGGLDRVHASVHRHTTPDS